jgi:hypothetical protein
MAKEQQFVISEQIFETTFFVKSALSYEKLEQVQMSNIPLVGQYYLQSNTQKLYNVEAVVQDDISVYIILSETGKGDPYFGFTSKIGF